MRIYRLFHIFLVLAFWVGFSSCKKEEPVASNSNTETTDDPVIPDEPSQPEEPDKPKSVPEQNGSGETNGYRLVWQDLFDADALNTSYWNIEENGDGGGNNELQFYRAKNISMGVESESNRHCLIITAKKQSYAGRPVTSGRLNTKGKVAYKHGKVEAMIKLPKTYKGLWPAFWMMGNDFDQVSWPACGELDILEMGNVNGMQTAEKSEKYLNGACHWGPRWDAHYSYGPSKEYAYSIQDGFHLVTVIWDEKAVNCYIDLDKDPNAKPYYTIDIEEVDYNDDTVAGNYFHKPFFIIFNLAVGGNFPQIWESNGITALNEANGYEAKMYIDYVRVYQKN